MAEVYEKVRCLYCAQMFERKRINQQCCGGACGGALARGEMHPDVQRYQFAWIAKQFPRCLVPAPQDEDAYVMWLSDRHALLERINAMISRSAKANARAGKDAMIELARILVSQFCGDDETWPRTFEDLAERQTQKQKNAWRAILRKDPKFAREWCAEQPELVHIHYEGLRIKDDNEP